ncbi:MAG: putative bifunctional diguanylate cyclase/phosphodiesterase [Ilumatobacteraceae bacterium]
MRRTWGDVGRYAMYAALTIVPVVVLGLLLARTVHSSAEQSARSEAVDRAATTARTTIEPYLVDGDLSDGPEDGRERRGFNSMMPQRLEDGTFLRYRIRSVTGRVVYDAARTAAGLGKPEVDEEIIEAVQSQRPLAAFTRVGADHIDAGESGTGDPHHGEDALEVYVPLFFKNTSTSSIIHDLDGDPATVGDRSVIRPNDSVVAGVAEMYLPYRDIRERADASVRSLVLMIAAGLAVLWLVLAGIVASVALREKRHREQAEQRAMHDRLTGLPGRTIFADRLAAAMAAGGRSGTDVALVVVDLDRFKEVNDTLGHRNGDELLQIVADRISRSLRPGDTVARLGGDEFGLVLPGARSASVEAILRRIQECLVEEVELGGVLVTVEVSMGYAMWPTDADQPDVLQQRADVALHAAKTARASIVRYDDGIDGFDPQRLTLLTELRRGITAGELVLHFQPKVDARSAHVVAFEALVRWQHPVRGLLMPDQFIPMAESTGLIVPLTHWVVDTALEHLAEWHRVHPMLAVAVNISARNLRDDLPAWVLQRLHAHGVHPSRLMLELTETSFAADPARATTLLQELDAAGVRVSLDDFGQGYTSLGSLGHLPVSELKIDRGFVMPMTRSPEDRAIVASVIELGHRLGLAVVAEGVETQETADLLRVLGCDLMQGYLFARPIPAGEVLALLDRMPAGL